MKMMMINHPWMDFILAAIIAILMFLTGKLIDPGIAPGTRIAVAGAITAFAGITAAAEIFVCSHIYSSNNERLKRLVEEPENSMTMARNWIYALLGTLGSAVFSIWALVVTDVFPTVTLSALLGAAVLTTMGFLRSVYWLNFALLQYRLNEKFVLIKAPEHIPTKPRRRPRRPQ